MPARPTARPTRPTAASSSRRCATLKPGEELFYDYGLIIDERYTPKLKKQFECRCGTRGLPRHDAGAEALSTASATTNDAAHQLGRRGAVAAARAAAARAVVEVVARTDSTNTQLLERARAAPRTVAATCRRAAYGRRAGDTQPCLLVAEHQTGGRGRLGRVWQSAPGASLTFSLALPLTPRDWSGLSLAVGVALAEALEPRRHGAAARPEVAERPAGWCDADGSGRKLGGMLIETRRRRRASPGGDRRRPQHRAGRLGRPAGIACLQELDAAASAPTVLARVAPPLVRALIEFERERLRAVRRALRRARPAARAAHRNHPRRPDRCRRRRRVRRHAARRR